MLEILTSGEKLVAIFIGANYGAPATRFITPNHEPIQLGIGVFKRGTSVEAHRHIGLPVTIKEFQEFIFVRRGKVIATVFDAECFELKKFEMVPGDCLLLLRGGHSFDFVEDTEFLELKQGPYLGREQMKEVFHAKSPTKPQASQTTTGAEKQFQ